jgi:hypothetical protein
MTNKGVSMKIAVEGFYALVPSSWSTQQILDFVIKVGKNPMKAHAKEVYELYYPSESPNFKASIDS